MKAAALLALLAALPADAGDAVTPAQARANVVQSFPPEIRSGLGNSDLRTYLQRLSPEQKQAALRSLTAKEGDLGDDPATLGVLGEAYAGLGKVKEAKEAAQAILRQNPDHPEAKRLMGWVTSQEKLAERGSGGGAFGDTRGPGGGGQSPAAATRQANLNALEQRVQGLFRRGQRSNEFQSTLQDARGMSVAELKAAGIEFQRAPANQQDAVMITRTEGGGFNIAIRDDALASGGDTEARGAAHVANGVRQAQTLRDHEYIGWALIKARGWISGARTHRELAPNDLDPRPTTQPDKDLMASRKMLDQKTVKFDPTKESFGDDAVNGIMNMFNSMVNMYGTEVLFQRFLTQTKRVN